jgi:hypothetical protein
VTQSVQTNPEIRASIWFDGLSGNVFEQVVTTADFGIK